MKRVGLLLFSLSFVVLQTVPTAVRAEISPLTPPVVINELQTNGPGTGTTGQEFIELKNISANPIDVSDWKVIYTPSSGLAASNKTIMVFPAGTIINYDGFLLITPADYLPLVTPKLTYQNTTTSNVMAATGGSITITNNISVVIDEVGWGTVATTLHEGDLVSAPKGGESIQRKIVDAKTVDTNNNKNDFEVLTVPTPEVLNTSAVVIPPDPVPDPPVIVDPPVEPVVETPPDPAPIVDPPAVTPPTNTETPATVEPTVSLLPIQLNELYIDPVSPEVDANDEWVELYNPNNTAVDIGNYAIFTGSNFSYHFTFKPGTIIAPNDYVVVTSGESSLALSNTAGAAKLVNDSGATIDEITYTESPAGESWAQDTNGTWVWTTSPTKDSANIFTVPLPPVLKVAAASAAKAKKSSTSTKSTAVKGSTTTKTKAKTAAKVAKADDPKLIAAPTPLPWWLLAVLMVLALLYVGYEYRFELANTIYRFRSNRSAGR